MDIELSLLFPTFEIIDGSNSDLDTIINIVENCHDKQFVYLQRTEICNQYFRIVEKVYNIKKIQLIIINGENVYYYPIISDLEKSDYFKFIANDVMERINKIICDNQI
jgi:hypothetical protein